MLESLFSGLLCLTACFACGYVTKAFVQAFASIRAFSSDRDLFEVVFERPRDCPKRPVRVTGVAAHNLPTVGEYDDEIFVYGNPENLPPMMTQWLRDHNAIVQPGPHICYRGNGFFGGGDAHFEDYGRQIHFENDADKALFKPRFM